MSYIGLSPGVRREVSATKQWFQAADNFSRVFAIRPGERVLILADPLLDPRVIDAVIGLAAARGAQVLNNSWGCPPIEGCDANALKPRPF